MKWLIVSIFAFILVLAPACTHHRVTVDPIYATIDINIKIDNRLNEFFAFEEELEEESADEPSPSPGTSREADRDAETGVQP